jgi:hypothetical protein
MAAKAADAMRRVFMTLSHGGRTTCRDEPSSTQPA